MASDSLPPGYALLPHFPQIAKLSPAPASAGLRLALFPFDPATHPPTHLPG